MGFVRTLFYVHGNPCLKPPYFCDIPRRAIVLYYLYSCLHPDTGNTKKDIAYAPRPLGAGPA